MLWMGGVWDARMNHRLVGFTGIAALLLVAKLAAAASGGPFVFRFIF